MNTSITAFAPMWIRCSAWPALRAATAPLVVVTIFTSFTVGPQGIEIQDIGTILEANSLAAALFLLLWSLAMAPAGRAALTAPGLRYLRALPAPTWFAPLHLAVILAFLQAPLALFILVAGKPALALALFGSGLGLSACFLLPRYRRWESLLSLVAGLGVVPVLGLGLLQFAPALGLATAIFFIPRSHRLAALPSRRRQRRARFGGPRWVLYRSQLLRFRRCESATGMRAVLLAAVGAYLVFVVNRANPGQDLADVTLQALVASTPGLAALTLTLAIALRRGQEEMHWLQCVLGVSTRKLRRSSLMVLLSVSVVFSFFLSGVSVYAASLSTSSAAPASAASFALLFVPVLVHSAFWASVASWLAYRVHGEGRDQSPAMIALCLVLADMLLVGMAGPWSLVLEAALSILLVSRILSPVAEAKGRSA